MFFLRTFVSVIKLKSKALDSVSLVYSVRHSRAHGGGGAEGAEAGLAKTVLHGTIIIWVKISGTVA